MASIVFLTFVSGLTAKDDLQHRDGFSWIDRREAHALQWLRKNISPALPTKDRGIIPARGSVQAASSEDNPPYRFDWTRDAALVMRIAVFMYRDERDARQRELTYQQLLDYINFTETKQASHPPSGLGEPKSHLDGSAFTDPWGRPQNDGPALRAVTMIQIAEILEERGESEILRRLWNPEDFANSMIGKDIEYTLTHWADPSFDLWEEIKGDHFYTHMVMRRALAECIRYAHEASHPEIAARLNPYFEQIDARVRQYWNPSKNIIDNTQNRSGGHEGKHSNLDSALILAVLHGSFSGETSFAIDDDRVISTAHQVEQKFREIYEINRHLPLGTAVGRYPEDYYYGGNPWILTTNAFSEFYFRLLERWMINGKILVSPLNMDFLRTLAPEMGQSLVPGAIIEATDLRFAQLTRKLKFKAEAFLRTADRYSNPDGSMPEQFDRATGAPLAAPDLTWSCASAIKAIHARKVLMTRR